MSIDLYIDILLKFLKTLQFHTFLYVKMRDEIQAAVMFISRLVKHHKVLSPDRVQKFERKLEELLVSQFENHWHPDKPWLGQAYRCLRVNAGSGTEPLIARAARDSGISYEDLKLPLEMTIWIDPEDVSCRFGEQTGTCCTVASFRNGRKNLYIDDIELPRDEDKTKVVTSPRKVRQFISQENNEESKENIAPMYVTSFHPKASTAQRTFHPQRSTSQTPLFTSPPLSVRNRSSFSPYGHIRNGHSNKNYQSAVRNYNYLLSQSSCPLQYYNSKCYYNGYPSQLSPTNDHIIQPKYGWARGTGLGGYCPGGYNPWFGHRSVAQV